MQMPIYEQLSDENFRNLIADNEFLCVLAGEGPHPPSISGLIEQAIPAMQRDFHFGLLHFGFLKSGSAKPYAVLEWKPGFDKRWQRSVEGRYVAHKLVDSIQTIFSFRKLTIFLSSEALDPQHLAIAEDIYTRFFDPLYTSYKLEIVRIASASSDRLHQLDPFQSVRLARQISFRAWVNENPDNLTSIAIGERLRDFCESRGVGIESFDAETLSEMGMNLLVAVGQASTRSPSRLHLATHALRPGIPPILLIGKGITFDTGGINLKPHESFVNCMKNDMGGAGLMAQLFMGLIESGFDHPLVLAIPACENLIAEKSFKPGAIIRSYAGKDVIIEHTDAEGRLILADALHYAQKRWKPSLTITAATLTTASLRQFTNWFTPVHFASPAFKEHLEIAGSQCGEAFTFWGEFLPFLDGNKNNAADLTNMGRMPSHANIGGGSNVAAHFLREFSLGPLTHFDIFASTWNWSANYPGANYGATGAPFNSLFRVLRQSKDASWIKSS